MSPDDATSTETGPAAEAEDAKPKKSMMERMAFMSKGGGKMDKVPGINKVPKSMRVLVVLLIVVVIVLAVTAIALMGGSDDKPDPGINTLNPTKLDDYDWSSGPSAGTASEFSETTMTLDTLIGENNTVLVDSITVTLEWQDEPDQTWAGRVRENSPDSFQLRIDVGNGNFTVESEMTSNDAGSKQGSVSLTMDMGLSNFTYVVVGNVTDVELPDDITDMGVNLVVIMGEAGDLYASGPAAFKLNDFGNDYTLTVTVSGKVVPAN